MYPRVGRCAGSKVVVELAPNFDHYIDAKDDRRFISSTLIEVVRRGFVRHRIVVHNDEAPEIIVTLIALEMGRKSRLSGGELERVLAQIKACDQAWKDYHTQGEGTWFAPARRLLCEEIADGTR